MAHNYDYTSIFPKQDEPSPARENHQIQGPLKFLEAPMFADGDQKTVSFQDRPERFQKQLTRPGKRLHNYEQTPC